MKEIEIIKDDNLQWTSLNSDNYTYDFQTPM